MNDYNAEFNSYNAIMNGHNAVMNGHNAVMNSYSAIMSINNAVMSIHGGRFKVYALARFCKPCPVGTNYKFGPAAIHGGRLKQNRLEQRFHPFGRMEPFVRFY